MDNSSQIDKSDEASSLLKQILKQRMKQYTKMLSRVSDKIQPMNFIGYSD